MRKAVSRAQLRRRRDPRMPGGDPVHLDLASSRRSRTVGPHRTARQIGDDRLRQRHGIHLECHPCQVEGS
ncbi:hypothetical protein AM571_PB00005 (plasmid) [Rhizobium etli 8C-3]|uniref:Uncharacterized protein n=1 Tax=Rhizobium etli 8C-3 TaxID=538025 RepID=A0A1L5PB30_RHIET|nr:hypothetical protein AM571_PB00005 [Rhizobium etli 8C-3]